MTITKSDQSLIDATHLTIWGPEVPRGALDPVEIDLQFPPKIISDSKKSEWLEHTLADYEKIKIYMGSDSRSLSVELYYIVEGGQFTAGKIAQICRNIRRYYYLAVDEGSRDYPIIQFYAYDVVPKGPSLPSWRMMDASFAYSPTLINDGNNIFPLKTTISLTMELVTKVKGKLAIKSGLDNIKELVKEWY